MYKLRIRKDLDDFCSAECLQLIGDGYLFIKKGSRLISFSMLTKHFHSPTASRWHGVIRPIVLIEFALTHIIASRTLVTDFHELFSMHQAAGPATDPQVRHAHQCMSA
jgi:hypothetical protein